MEFLINHKIDLLLHKVLPFTAVCAAGGFKLLVMEYKYYKNLGYLELHIEAGVTGTGDGWYR